jgi:transcriptional regulator with XRE-family HTH domain
MADEQVPIWASNLRKLTAASQLSQAELARRSGMQRDSFGRYVLGKTMPPDAKLIAIAKVFGVKPSDIDPDRTELDGIEMQSAPARTAYSISPSLNGEKGRVFLEVATEMPFSEAAKIVQIITESSDD